MVNVPGSQAPETQALLSENIAHADSYRDDPEVEGQQLNLNVELANQAAQEGSTASPKGPNPVIPQGEGRKGDSVGLTLVAGGAALLVVTTWSTVLGNDPKALGLFAYHPTLQSLSVSLFAFGILTLQPTSSPTTKKAGLLRHQLIILGLAIPCICVGGFAIIWNKIVHGAPHFITWHGTFGILAISWMLLQTALGAGSVWFGGAAFGGGAKAKGVWKYHRLSGYMLLLFFLMTVALGGGFSDWMVASTSQVTRIFGYTIAPIAILIGLWSRARLSKMKFV